MILNEIQENDRSFDYWYLLKRMFPFITPYIGRALIGIALAVPVGLLDGVVAFALKPYMDEVIVNKNVQFAIWIPFLIVGFAALQGVLKYLNTYLSSWAGGKLTNNLKNILFEKLIAMDTEFYDRNTTGIIINRFLGDADAAITGILSHTRLIISTVCTSLALIFVLLYNSWELALVSVIVLLASMIPMMFIRTKIKEISHKSMKLGGVIFTNLTETCAGNQTITSYNLKSHQAEIFKDKLHEAFNLGMTLIKRTGWLSPVMYLIASVGIAIVMWYGNQLIISGQITSGGFASFITALLLLYKPIKTLGVVMASLQGSFVSMARITELLDIKPKIHEKPSPIELTEVKNNVSINNICFEYDKNRPVLNNISLEANIGETIALVGNSGGGKSTIAKLIPRFYDVKEGSILIDGTNIKDFSLKSLRDNISMVFQHNFLFSGTIKENILLGKFDATDEEIKEALKNAYLNEFVDSLPFGIDTHIGEQGGNLSGGQRQRLAIARAMIKNAPILILDEATSALDNKSEKIVQKALEKLMQNRTVFVIAHRLSTIKNANKIAVIDQGNLVELGTHEELMNIESGSYKSLYDAQFKKQETANC